MNQPSDRRILRTQKNIKQAFTELLEQKPFDKITVAEVAELADINRRTFYLHYEDIYALLEQLELDLIGEFNDDLQISAPQILHEFQTQLLVFLGRRKQLMHALLSNPNSQFLGKAMALAIERDLAHSSYTTKTERKYCWQYIEHGLRGVLLDWLVTASLPQAKMADFITREVESSLAVN
ncbi:TetR/AcrR family transcriptional regulator [Furfurilactobacillus sp. WILCCON 0119]|uniref:TetR/AcrR family transcriptional regulator n=1 Tax=Furfurilactobacillus entadae TaxID=2922307 RepID=UPI0035F09DA3